MMATHRESATKQALNSPSLIPSFQTRQQQRQQLREDLRRQLMQQLQQRHQQPAQPLPRMHRPGQPQQPQQKQQHPKQHPQPLTPQPLHACAAALAAHNAALRHEPDRVRLAQQSKQTLSQRLRQDIASMLNSATSMFSAGARATAQMAKTTGRPDLLVQQQQQQQPPQTPTSPQQSLQQPQQQQSLPQQSAAAAGHEPVPGASPTLDAGHTRSNSSSAALPATGMNGCTEHSPFMDTGTPGSAQLSARSSRRPSSRSMYPVDRDQLLLDNASMFDDLMGFDTSTLVFDTTLDAPFSEVPRAKSPPPPPTCLPSTTQTSTVDLHRMERALLGTPLEQPWPHSSRMAGQQAPVSSLSPTEIDSTRLCNEDESSLDMTFGMPSIAQRSTVACGASLLDTASSPHSSNNQPDDMSVDNSSPLSSSIPVSDQEPPAKQARLSPAPSAAGRPYNPAAGERAMRGKRLPRIMRKAGATEGAHGKVTAATNNAAPETPKTSQRCRRGERTADGEAAEQGTGAGRAGTDKDGDQACGEEHQPSQGANEDGDAARSPHRRQRAAKVRSRSQIRVARSLATNKRFPRRSTQVLKQWLLQHVDNPYPSESEKEVLMEHSGLNLLQLNNWFINARRRVLKKVRNDRTHPKFEIREDAVDDSKE